MCAHHSTHTQTHESTLEMTIKYKQNSCQEQEQQQPGAKSKTKPQQDDQVECPAANFKCAQSNNNGCCGGVYRSVRGGGGIRESASGKQKKLAQRKVHKTYLGNVFKFDIKNIGAETGPGKLGQNINPINTNGV